MSCGCLHLWCPEMLHWVHGWKSEVQGNSSSSDILWDTSCIHSPIWNVQPAKISSLGDSRVQKPRTGRASYTLHFWRAGKGSRGLAKGSSMKTFFKKDWQFIYFFPSFSPYLRFFGGEGAANLETGNQQPANNRWRSSPGP